MTTENTSEVVAPATASVESTSENTSAPATTQMSGLDSLKAQAKAAQAPTETPAKPADKTPAEVFSAEPAAVVPPAFQPNWKFKASNKEYEVDEWLRGVIKDADTEKKAKDMLTRAYAFDDYKSRNEQMGQSYSQLLNDHKSLDKDVSRVMGFRNQGDYDNFFAALKIPKEDIYTWVKQQLELDAATPEQRRAYDTIMSERQRAADYQNENTQVQEMYQQAALQARQIQLDMALMKPDVSQKASAWDEKVGKAGSFRDTVISEAKLVAMATQQDLSAEEAVNLVLQKYGKFLEAGASAAVVPEPQAPTPVQNVVVKPVIPTIAGKGTSPVNKKPKSIDDLRAMGKDLQSQGR